MAVSQHSWMRNPFRYFKTAPETIRLAVMMLIRFPLPPRQVEDLLHDRTSIFAVKQFASVGTMFADYLK